MKVNLSILSNDAMKLRRFPWRRATKWVALLTSLSSLPGLLLITTASYSSARAAITISPTFDSSITGNANAADIMASINSAIQVYQTTILTPITVNITFKASESISLGQSATLNTDMSYSQFLTDLTAVQSSANDTLALANLGGGPNNPVNGNANIRLTLPLLRALGETVLGDNGGGNDGIITLKTSIMNLTRTGPQNPVKYDLLDVVSHEINEVLGLGSALTGLANGAPNPTGAIKSMDIFRYDQNGNRSFTTAAAAEAYFSLDGTTRLTRFNQVGGADFMDFAAGTPQVQDAFATAGVQINMGVNEWIALDVIGYSLAAVPEPRSVACWVGMALIGFAAVRKRVGG